MATLGFTDLGLDPRKFPDLTDLATRRRLSSGAIHAFFQIIDHWGLKNEDAMALLGGVSSGRYYQLKKNQKGLLSRDELTSVSLLIGIYKALNILFSRKLANQWVTRANSNPLFQNVSPLTVMKQGILQMLTVRRFLDSRRGG